MRARRVPDAAAIGAVHVAAWRSTYPGILPDDVSGAPVGAPPGGALRVGDPRRRRACTWRPPPAWTWPAGGPRGWWGLSPAAARASAGGGKRLGEGEIETLYVLDDWRERGLGRRLMRVAAAHLAASGCKSAFVWVLRENPSRWFYERLGGRVAAEATVRVGGTSVVQMAYVWPSTEKLEQAASSAS